MVQTLVKSGYCVLPRKLEVTSFPIRHQIVLLKQCTAAKRLHAVKNANEKVLIQFKKNTDNGVGLCLFINLTTKVHETTAHCVNSVRQDSEYLLLAFNKNTLTTTSGNKKCFK